jgi:hypothetical protein
MQLISPVTYGAKILKKYFTKQNSTWTIEGVTYRRTNAPNLSNNWAEQGDRKIEVKSSKNSSLSRCVIVFGREKELGRKR